MVYFTTVNWFDLYTGARYLRNQQYTISGVKLTDRVPLFIIEGSMILTQNTDNVKSTKDLDNVFILTATFTKDATSNATHLYYSSAGTHISLKDYNENSKIEACLSLTCEYFFNLLVSQNPQSTTLTVNTNYVGVLHLNERIEINEVRLYSDAFNIQQKLETNIIVNGNSKTVVPLKSGQSQGSNIRIEQE